MPKVSNEAFRAFNEGLEKCTKKVGGGKIGMDTICVRNLVRANKDAAYRFVEIHCMMAPSQPGYVQPAIIIATAYQIEFQDNTLYEMVMNTAKELGAEKHINALGMFKNLEEATTEPPQREAAREWWRKTGQADGRCDNCNRSLRRGEGYMISGRTFRIGDQRMDMGEELICQDCFTNLNR
ncbi:MAG TPA: hypothetical protein VJM50_13715 [Pyrinomonadaceae bacterium]|nr:hypothetical protein [Pyrinomonadaceae bacterium]